MKYYNLTEKMYNYLVDNYVATDDEIAIATGIEGWNEEAMKDVLYIKTGYRDFDQLEDDFYSGE